MTKYRKIAIKISKNLKRNVGVCGYLYDYEDLLNFFKEYFQPTIREGTDYNMLYFHWLASNDSDSIEDNEFRILALLFCEQLWLDEQKTK